MEECDSTDDVRAYYESGSELGRLGTARGTLERVRTQELLLRYLRRGDEVLDVGGGTGVYAAWLASLGHRVHLLEPVTLHLEEARRRAESGHPFTVDRADARTLPVVDETFDAVLVLGPLYHLSDAGDRDRALAEARRVCRRGGVVAAAAISRFAPALDTLADGRIDDEEIFRNVADETAHGVRVSPSRRKSPFPDAYFHRPDELAHELRAAGLELEGVFGIEGAGWLLADLEDRLADERRRERVLWAARAFEQEPALAGISAHLLAVGRRR